MDKSYAYFLVLVGFAISVCLTNLTKWLYVEYSFRYPLFLTGTHMLTSYAASAMALFVFKMVPNPPKLPLKEQVMLIAPFSIAGAASLGCANMALVYLYPSFHQMLQNTTPIWTVLCAMALQGKRYNTATFFCLVPVCGGGIICALNEKSAFALFGLILSLLAAALRAVKSVMQAALLQDVTTKIDSVSLVYYSSPFNLGLFLVASLANEGVDPWRDFVLLSSSGQACVWLAALAAAAYNLIAFLTVGYLGAVMSMAVGNMKAPTTIMVSCTVFGNPFTIKQLLGFITGLAGVFLYDRYSKEHKPAKSSDEEGELQPAPARTNGSAPQAAEVELTDADPGEEDELLNLRPDVLGAAAERRHV